MGRGTGVTAHLAVVSALVAFASPLLLAGCGMVAGIAPASLADCPILRLDRVPEDLPARGSACLVLTWDSSMASPGPDDAGQAAAMDTAMAAGYAPACSMGIGTELQLRADFTSRYGALDAAAAEWNAAMFVLDPDRADAYCSVLE